MEMNTKLREIARKLEDQRSKKIIFLSHCILNSNTRYLGGAFCSGMNPLVLAELTKSNYGIVQLPCPEQMAWGGILKRFIWIPLGSKGKLRSTMYKALLPLFLCRTKWIYSRLASKVVLQMKDYVDSGYELIELVGVDGSPSCGVHKTLGVTRSFEYIAGLSLDSLSREEYNKNLYNQGIKAGNGLFIKILLKKLNRKGIKIKLTSIDIQEEMKAIK